MQREILIERFFTSLISGQRDTAREIVDEIIEADCPARSILAELFWPTLEQVQNLYRNDQMSEVAHHYATRLMRMLVDQMQLRLEQKPARDKTVLVTCGPEEPEELAAQMVCDLLEAEGYTVRFAGGGVANDEIVEQIGALEADILLVFGGVASTVPSTRLLIDRMHDIGLAPGVQIVLGGGIFNRAEGLAEELGADLWAKTPEEVVDEINTYPDRRMQAGQRTVGRKRRSTKRAEAA